MNGSEERTRIWTRRDLLTKVGQLGGAAALYETMVALGLINVPPAWAGMPDLSECDGAGKKVVILGAGIGGLTTAYLLSGCGYHCRILEATSRAGGRIRTARRGSEIIEESKENGKTIETKQTCKFDEGLYLNLGPGRIPYHHRRVLGYCKKLEVKLEPYVMNTTGNLVHTTSKDGKPLNAVYRHVQNDTRGYISELLAKAVNKGSLDEELIEKEIDKEKLLRLLEKFGQVKSYYINERPVYFYEGSKRDGCVRDTPSVDRHCEWYEDERMATPPLAWEDLLESKFWDHGIYNPFEFNWQSTLFQPVGGMDKIVEGFMHALRRADRSDFVEYHQNAPVVGIDATEDGDKVSVSYKQGTEIVKYEADYCVCNIPLSVLRNIENNIEGDYAEAIKHPNFAASCKVGWQCNQRFWESDKYEIYGGISWTDDIIEQIWYPSNDYFSQKGTLTGAYIHDKPGDGPKHATEFGKLPIATRLDDAKKAGAKLHEEINVDAIVPTENGLSIAWQNIPFQEGAWADWQGNDDDDRHYKRLLSPYGRFYLVGDQVSTLPGWQEGAMISAEHVVKLIARDRPYGAPEGVTAPNAFEVTQGRG